MHTMKTHICEIWENPVNGKYYSSIQHAMQEVSWRNIDYSKWCKSSEIKGEHAKCLIDELMKDMSEQDIKRFEEHTFVEFMNYFLSKFCYINDLFPDEAAFMMFRKGWLGLEIPEKKPVPILITGSKLKELQELIARQVPSIDIFVELPSTICQFSGTVKI